MKSSKYLSLAEALARLETWREDPTDAQVHAVIDAARAWAASDCNTEAESNLLAAVDALSDQREMTDTARNDLREADTIVELDPDAHGMFAVMARARGCHIAATVKRLGGRLVAFASTRGDP